MNLTDLEKQIVEVLNILGPATISNIRQAIGPLSKKKILKAFKKLTKLGLVESETANDFSEGMVNPSTKFSLNPKFQNEGLNCGREMIQQLFQVKNRPGAWAIGYIVPDADGVDPQIRGKVFCVNENNEVAYFSKKQLKL